VKQRAASLQSFEAAAVNLSVIVWQLFATAWLVLQAGQGRLPVSGVSGIQSQGEGVWRLFLSPGRLQSLTSLLGSGGIVPITLLVAAPYAGVRRSLELLLAARPEISVVGEAGSLPATLQLLAELQPDMLLVAADLPGMQSSGGSTGDLLVAASPETRILVLGIDDGASAAAALQRLRGTAYVQFERAPDDLESALACLAAGKYYLPGSGCQQAGSAT
jgi:hypothetical protein